MNNCIVNLSSNNNCDCFVENLSAEKKFTDCLLFCLKNNIYNLINFINYCQDNSGNLRETREFNQLKKLAIVDLERQLEVIRFLEKSNNNINILEIHKQNQKRLYDRYYIDGKLPLFVTNVLVETFKPNQFIKELVTVEGIFNVLNISLGGIFVEFDYPVKKGDKIYFTIILDNQNYDNIEVQAIIWNISEFRGKKGIGIEFFKINKYDEHKWENFINIYMKEEFKY